MKKKGPSQEVKREDFAVQLRQLINQFSLESDSNTPDFILVEYIMDCLKAFENALGLREEFYGRKVSPAEVSE